jgi:type II secretory ATPase GspE/PulE/Tfp pilus assembly ATPase PilB-like protein
MDQSDVTAKKKRAPRIGELLVREGFIKESDLRKAFLIQKKEEKEASLPFESLLVRKGFLNASQLEILRGHPDVRKRIGQMIVEHELIGGDQIKEALRDKKKHSTLGQSLIEKGLIGSEMLDELLEQQKEALNIGELALKLQMLSEIDLVRALSYKSSQRTIGEILVENGVIRPEDLSLALKKHNKRKRIGEILIRQGMIDENEFQTALKEQSRSKEKIGAFLVNKGLITSHQLYNAFSHQYNTPYVELDDFSYDELGKIRLLNCVDEKYARRNMVLPLTLEGKQMLLGIVYPEGLKTIEELQLVYRNLSMKAVFITEKKFETLFMSLYNKDFHLLSETEDEFQNLSDNVNLFNFETLSAREKQQINVYSGTEIEIKKVVDYIINYGVSIGASDIHFEQDRKGVKLRYRIDGVCQESNILWLKEQLRNKPEAIISRIKVMSNLDISERRMPQDGVFRASYKDKNKIFDLDFRVASCPAIVGENITIRILDSRKAGLDLNNLNHSKHVLGPLKQMFKSPAGMILLSGPTGSGKTSTLYAALKYINGPEIKIITAEDPIEYSFPGIMQTQINNKIGLTFARLLRSFLRLDPDVILVGEMRDSETAGIGFDAAQTGHLLLSTIHTNDSVGVIPRLLDLGIDHNQIASTIIGVVSQRLVRRNCIKCSRPSKPLQEEWGLFFNEYPSHIKFYKGVGCKSCDFTGYNGRTLISELLEINPKLTLAISCKTGETELRHLAIKNGMRTMADDGLMKMNQISLSELIRVLPLEMIKEFQRRH